MADTLTKVLITSIFISLLLGTTMEIYNQQTTWTSVDIDLALAEHESIPDIIGDSANWDAERKNQLTDQTVLTPIGTGKSVLNILKWGFIPLPIGLEQVNTQIEKIFMNGL